MRLGYGLDDRGIGGHFPVGAEDFSLHSVQTDSWVHTSSPLMGSADVNRPILEADHSLPFSAEVKNTSTPPYVSIWSLDSSVGTATGYSLDIPSSFSTVQDFSLLHSDRRWGPLSLQCVPGALSSGIKRPGPEADHSSPSNAEVKKRGAIPPLLHTFSCHSVSQIKQRDNFTLTFTACPRSVLH
jgi:hypothetical protein